jgi:ribosomal-protein-alanine N-acetyltransferase
MEGTKELTTKRLLLRKYRQEDAQPLYEKFGIDPKMYEYSGWNPYADPGMAEESVREFINSYENTDFYGWAIEKDGTLIGTIGAYDYDKDNNTIEVGMSIARDSWGQGFATEALTCVLEYLTDHEGISTVTAWCAGDNAGSVKVMLKSGMVRTDTVTDGLEVDGKTFDRLLFAYHAGV